MRRAHLLTVCSSLLLVAALGTPASAITYGAPDEGRHPNVGSMIIKRDGHNVSFCSGTLIDANSFLTAAHCTDYIVNSLGLGPEDLWVTFDEVVSDTSALLDVASINQSPAYAGGHGEPGDIAVVELAEPSSLTPAALPTAGFLTRLNKRGALEGRTFTNVGYGLGERIHSKGSGTPRYIDEPNRKLSTSTFTTLTKPWLKLSQNPKTGDGGTCFGDSGGPQFFGGVSADLVVSITITGDSVCRSTNVAYRLDTAAARSFLAAFVTLP